MKGPGAAQPRNNAPFHSLSDTYTWSYMNDPPRLPQDLIWSAAPLSPASAPTDVFIIALSRRRRAGRGRRGAGGEGAQPSRGRGEQEPPCSCKAPEMPGGARGHQGVPGSPCRGPKMPRAALQQKGSFQLSTRGAALTERCLVLFQLEGKRRNSRDRKLSSSIVCRCAAKPSLLVPAEIASVDQRNPRRARGIPASRGQVVRLPEREGKMC